MTKTYPAADVLALASLGLTDFGENRDQEAAPKAAAPWPRPRQHKVTWHFIGQLQSNKAHQRGSVPQRYVHSVDRPPSGPPPSAQRPARRDAP